MTGSDNWSTIRKKALQRDDYSCQRCGAKGGEEGNQELHVHHILPKAEGGSNQLENLTTLCRVCHDEIHSGGSGKISRATGDQFEEWLEEYVGPRKEPWQSRYICIQCGHEWSGKPYSERSSTIYCPSNECGFRSGSVCIEVGDLFIPINTIHRLKKYDQELDYTTVEIRTPIDIFAPDSIFEYESEYVEGTLSHLVYSQTRAECEKCGEKGGREFNLIFDEEILAEPITQSMVLCLCCKDELKSNRSMRLD